MEELVAIVAKLKNGKAGGSSCILPEMVKVGCCKEEFMTIYLTGPSKHSVGGTGCA